MKLGHFGIIAIVALLFVATFTDFSSLTVPFSEDSGLTWAVTQHGLHGEIPLLGPPSHIGGRHIGPFFYWHQIAVAFLAGGDPFLTVLMLAVLRVLAIVGLAYLVSKSAHTPFGAFAGGAAVLVTAINFQLLEIVRAPWQPHELLVTGTLFLWSVSRLLDRPSLSEAPWVLLTSSLFVQTHFAAALLILPVLACSFPRFILSDRTPSRGYLYLGVGRVLLILVWLPTMIYFLRYPETLSNLLAGSELATASSSGPRHVLSSLAGTVTKLLPFTPLFPTFVRRILWLTVLAGALGTNIPLFKAKTAPLNLGILCALVVYFLVLAAVRPPIYSYYLYPLIPALLFLLGTLLATCGDAIIKHRVRFAAPILPAILPLVAAGNCWIVLGRTSTDWTQPANSLLHAIEMGDGLRADAGDAPFALQAFNQSKVMKGAFRSFAGEPGDSLIDGWDRLKEISSPSVGPSSGYLIACPRPFYRERRAIEEKVSEAWIVGEELTFPQCDTCRGCMLKRIEKRN